MKHKKKNIYLNRKMQVDFLIRIVFLSIYVQCQETNDADDRELTIVTTGRTDLATTQSYRLSRSYRRDRDDHEDNDEEEDMDDSKSMAKSDYWGGYYDFLINEGSYKFWAVFQLATAALLIYSGFAALYYAKVNPATTDDYEDYFLRRRRREIPTSFFSMDPATFQRIVDSIQTKFND